MYQNYYHEQLAKISTCVKYLKDTYDRYILPRYFLLLCFGNLNSRDYDSDSLGMLCFPGFLTVSHRFPWCFRMFPPAFLRFPLVFRLFSRSVSSVSYFRFCVVSKCLQKMQYSISESGPTRENYNSSFQWYFRLMFT